MRLIIAALVTGALAIASIAPAATRPAPRVFTKAERAGFRTALAKARALPQFRPLLPATPVLESHETVTPRAPWQGETGLQLIADSIPVPGVLAWDTPHDRLVLPATSADLVNGPATGLLYRNVAGRTYLATCRFDPDPEGGTGPSLGTVAWLHKNSPDTTGSARFDDLTALIAIPPGTGGPADLHLVLRDNRAWLRQCDLYGFTAP